ncbi:hypothetical protein T459_13570 [Capsicum annuum]|uniref:Uncharacterized protein n=1 Tax=Capsicum annuum TaxID=4072 RepID=A0A2G2ZF77_CAPAN|nr:hypothetical protein T459_13570 [Capsicum annuum]
MGGLLRKNLSMVGILRMPLVLTTVTWSHVLQWSSVESKSQPLNEPLLDADTTSFGFLGEMPQNFGFSDLTADFTNSSALNSLFLLIESDVLGLGEFATCLFSCSLFGATVLFDWVCLDVLLVVAEGALLSDNSMKNE